MSERDAMEYHIQSLIDMNEPGNAQDRIIVWGYSEITKLQAEVAELEQKNQRLMVLVIKHCSNDHHDWPEVVAITAALEVYDA